MISRCGSSRPFASSELRPASWQTHESELPASGDLFFTWQYDIRWAAQHLQNVGVFVAVDNSRTKAVDNSRTKEWTLSTVGQVIQLHGVLATSSRAVSKLR